ncbi:MAG: PAS domain-containing protein, partial [Gammaproteobacteria bacterium]|nr:PAS domain-containing protein [Gammaproteobacteria bacterium]
MIKEGLKEQLNALLPSMPHLVAWKNCNLAYGGCNQPYAKLFGYSDQTELIGHTDTQLNQHFSPILTQLDSPEEEQQILASGHSVLNKKIVISDDDTEQTMLVSKTPLYDELNKISGLLITLVNLAENKYPDSIESIKALHQEITDIYCQATGLASSEVTLSPVGVVKALSTYYKNIIACLPNHVYWLDNNCQLLGGNQIIADMFGVSSVDDLFGLSYKDMTRLANWTEKQGDKFKNDEINVMRSGIPTTNQPEPPVIINGQKRYYMSSKVPLYDPTKKHVIGVVGISTEVTNLKEKEFALIEQNKKVERLLKIKSEFIQNMSHDLRTALTGLLSVAEIQADNLPDHHEHKEHFVLMRDASRDLHAFCETVLETASLDHPSDLEAPTPFSLETLITHKVELFKPAMRHKGLTCSVKTLSDSLPPLLGHPLLLE